MARKTKSVFVRRGVAAGIGGRAGGGDARVMLSADRCAEKAGMDMRCRKQDEKANASVGHRLADGTRAGRGAGTWASTTVFRWRR